MWDLYLIVRSLVLLNVANLATLASESVTEVTVVEGMPAELPCLSMSSSQLDTLTLVIWYFGQQMTPIYSYDKRSGSEAQHWSDKNSSSSPNTEFSAETSLLEIHKVSYTDNGRYRCRVDYRGRPTSYSDVRLNVIVPPSSPELRDSKNNLIRSLTIVALEGQNLHLSCAATKGTPTPRLAWLIRRSDGSFERLAMNQSAEQSKDSGENHGKNHGRIDLRLSQLVREDHAANIACEAVNNNITQPAHSNVTLDMLFRPRSVTISGPSSPVSADREHTFTCRSEGSRPPAKLTWYLNGAPLHHRTTQEVSNDGSTTGKLRLLPGFDQQNGTLICSATNPRMPDATLRYSVVITVKFAPKAVLRLSRILQSDNIREGNDVFFTCHVTANPPADRIIWLYEDEPVRSEPGVLNTGTSLVLQNITRSRAGLYRCRAVNSEGSAVSNAVSLRVKFSPVCAPRQRSVYGSSRHQPITAICRVHSDPPPTLFTWWLNSSAGLEVVSNKWSTQWSGGPHISHLRLLPSSGRNFGQLMCEAENAVGRQFRPCIYHLVPAVVPEAVKHCVINNLTETSMRVRCDPSYDGGQKQVFHVLILDSSGRPVYNDTQNTPRFFIGNLLPGVKYETIVYAVNKKGASPKIRLSITTPANKSTHSSESVLGSVAQHHTPGDWTQLVGAALGALLVLTGCVIAVVLLLRSRARGPAKRGPPNDGGSSTLSEIGAQLVGGDVEKNRAGSAVVVVVASGNNPVSSDAGFDTNPDVIPPELSNLHGDYRLDQMGSPCSTYSPVTLNHLAFGRHLQGSRTMRASPDCSAHLLATLPLQRRTGDDESIV